MGGKSNRKKGRDATPAKSDKNNEPEGMPPNSEGEDEKPDNHANNTSDSEDSAGADALIEQKRAELKSLEESAKARKAKAKAKAESKRAQKEWSIFLKFMDMEDGSDDFIKLSTKVGIKNMKNLKSIGARPDDAILVTAGLDVVQAGNLHLAGQYYLALKRRLFP